MSRHSRHKNEYGNKENKYTIIKTMEEGRGFGETAIIQSWYANSLRLAYVHTLKPTWFFTID